MPRVPPARVWTLIVLTVLAGCGSPAAAPDSSAAALPPAAAGRPLVPDEAFELAMALRRRGSPSPTPELDALTVAAEATTPELGLEELLGSAGAPSGLELLPGDEVEVRVHGEPDLSGRFVVGWGGRVELPLVGALLAQGRTARGLADEVRAKLEGTYLRRAVVSAWRTASAPRTASVEGRVEKPGTIELPADLPLSLHALVTRAGGLAPDADGARLMLVRSSGEERVCYHLAHDALVRAHFARRDVWVQPGDRLIVPRLPDAFLYGAVRQPGRVPLRAGSTVASLLWEAGLADDADVEDVRLLGDDGEAARVRVEEVVTPGSVLYVPQRHRIYVVGEVQDEGPVTLPRSQLTLLDAIVAAGWFTEDADRDDVEIVRVGPDGRAERLRVSARDLLAGRATAPHMALQPGDRITVGKRVW